MQSKLSPNQIERLRRESKKIARAEGIPYTQVIDRAAHQLGYRNWALMQNSLRTTPPRFPVFSRTADEMRQAFRKVPGVDGGPDVAKAIRSEMPDLSRQFANPMSALEYARDYLRLALSLPRFAVRGDSAAYFEMRVLLPYVFHPLEGEDRFIILGRDYKPLGFPTRGPRVDYELYTNLHVRLPAAAWHQTISHPDCSPGYLYRDGINPSNGRAYANALLQHLDAVIELVGAYEQQSMN